MIVYRCNDSEPYLSFHTYMVTIHNYSKLAYEAHASPIIMCNKMTTPSLLPLFSFILLNINYSPVPYFFPLIVAPRTRARRRKCESGVLFGFYKTENVVV